MGGAVSRGWARTCIGHTRVASAHEPDGARGVCAELGGSRVVDALINPGGNAPQDICREIGRKSLKTTQNHGFSHRYVARRARVGW